MNTEPKRNLQTYKKAPSRTKNFFSGGRVQVKVGKLVEKLSGGHHGIYESNVGLVRKPLQ